MFIFVLRCNRRQETVSKQNWTLNVLKSIAAKKVLAFNILSPKSDQHQFSPCNIFAHKTLWSQELRD